MNEALLRRLPKLELHVHLEGAIPLETLLELQRKYGVRPALSLDALRERFVFRDFPHFIDAWVWKNGLLRELDDFTLMAEAVARNWVEDGLVYVEAHYSPPDFYARGLSLAQLTEAVRRGFEKVSGVEVHLIADLVRDFGPQLASRTLDELLEVASAFDVLGVGLGGSEHQYPAEPFAPVYRRAREHGLHCTAHAGEAAGAQSVRAAVELLGVERVGHATRAVEDPALVALLAERRIGIECCPLSNVSTGVISTLSEHPIVSWLERGLCVSVNSDDPVMFQSSMSTELRALHEQLGLSAAQLLQLQLNAIEASWQSEQAKDELAAQLRACWPSSEC
ncbi:MAG: adenosine deaminase [Myxococcota bacterium]|jgi:adenosine deaminase|nr:adenosine deaminase [Myxococcota bacterium]